MPGEPAGRILRVLQLPDRRRSRARDSGVLVPIVLVTIAGAHILLAWVRGVAHPLPARLGGPGTGKEGRRAQATAESQPGLCWIERYRGRMAMGHVWTGSPVSAHSR
jgi:hypothetical protein